MGPFENIHRIERDNRQDAHQHITYRDEKKRSLMAGGKRNLGNDGALYVGGLHQLGGHQVPRKKKKEWGTRWGKRPTREENYRSRRYTCPSDLTERD